MNISDEYVPVSLTTILVNTKVGCNLYLKTCENNEINYILYCDETNVFSQNKISVLKKYKIENLYIHKQDHKVYLKYLEPCLKKIIDNEDVSSTEKARIVYNVAKNIMEEVFGNPRSGKNVERAKNWVNNTIDIILRDNKASVMIEVLSFDYYTYTHSVNVCILGLLFSRYLRLKIEDLNGFGIGLLLHDIGKTCISPDILNRRGKLTNKEFGEMKMHVELGAKMLLEMGGIDNSSFLPVMQHHEKISGKGYPKGLKGNAIHKYGRIAAIIDVYDALTTRRPYCDARKPFVALKIMRDEMCGCFDEELYKDFILFLKQAI